MQHAQFRAIPPLEKVEQLFMLLTARPFAHGISWNTWVFPSTNTPFEEFRPYIRTSHQTVLNSLIAGTARNPAAFLRQLLRPHNWTIKTTYTNDGSWQLQALVSSIDKQPTADTIRYIKKPIIIDWD